MLEAFEQNRPVLATPVGGHLGMIEPGRDGWLLDDTGADGLVSHMERLIDSRDEIGEVLRAQGPRQKFARLTDPEPVREGYADLLGRDGERGVARRRPARAGGPQPEAPLVSIVIPYFQMERFVEDTLASIAAQTYDPDRDDHRQRRLDARAGFGAVEARRPVSVLARDSDQLRARPGPKPRCSR